MEDKHTVSVGRSAGTQARCGANAPRRILVVDDDEAIRLLNTEVLIHFGYHVDAAEDGAAAWNTLQRKSYDLLLTDNQMPYVSGVELLQKIRDFCIPMPVILVTGTLPEAEFIRRPWLQPAATLLKPYTPDELLRTVQTVLNARDSGREQVDLRLSAPSQA